MCGLVGIIGSRKLLVDVMLESMNHRGIDNRGIFKNDKISLGHNRLSINDLSDKGNQPFHYQHIHLIVNGEIWNYPVLRTEYESRGYNFQSNSDSEIILYLYKEDELNRLDGMFSFILYNSDTDKLIVSRDWCGKVPLWMETNEDGLSFVSEIKSLNPQSRTGSKLSIVPPNSLIEIDVNTLDIKTNLNYYFQFSDDIPSLDNVGKKTYELLDDAVQKRLLSDVKIATCLSGGIDSSTITLLLNNYIDNLTAYTIKFDENSKDLIHSRIVANHLGIKLIEIEVPRDEELIKDRFYEVIQCIEYPTSVQTQVGILQSFIAEQMKDDGVKVCFSGEGSDESYGSYGMIRMFSKKSDWSEIRKNLFKKQHYGNLLRGNNIFMKYGTIELRTPFFDTDFLNYTTNLPNSVLTDKQNWKLPLSNAFDGLLPDIILNQEKRAFQKSVGFKDFIEEIILEDKIINRKNRRRFLDVVVDVYKDIYGLSPRDIKSRRN